MDERQSAQSLETASRLAHASQGFPVVQWSAEQRTAVEARFQEINAASSALADALNRAYLIAGAQLCTEMARMMRPRA